MPSGSMLSGSLVMTVGSPPPHPVSGVSSSRLVPKAARVRAEESQDG